MKICGGDGTDFHRGKLQYKQKSMSSTPTVFENLWKSIIQYCEASYVYILSGQKFIKKAKKWSM